MKVVVENLETRERFILDGSVGVEVRIDHEDEVHFERAEIGTCQSRDTVRWLPKHKNNLVNILQINEVLKEYV